MPVFLHEDFHEFLLPEDPNDVLTVVIQRPTRFVSLKQLCMVLFIALFYMAMFAITRHLLERYDVPTTRYVLQGYWQNTTPQYTHPRRSKSLGFPMRRRPETVERQEGQTIETNNRPSPYYAFAEHREQDYQEDPCSIAAQARWLDQRRALRNKGCTTQPSLDFLLLQDYCLRRQAYCPPTGTKDPMAPKPTPAPENVAPTEKKPEITVRFANFRVYKKK